MKNYKCIKPWRGYEIGDIVEVRHAMGPRNTIFVGGSVISWLELKEHFSAE